jgi:hypothetical protein
MTRKLFDWSPSRSAGDVTEVAILAPIRRGTVPGERRTYEERALAVIANIQGRVQQGLPNELNLVPSIHFGRIMLLRPEHYLLGSDLADVKYVARPVLTAGVTPVPPPYSIPEPIDEYVEGNHTMNKGPELRSFLLTTVEFDGDLRVYFRDIAVQLRDRFNQIFANCEEFPGTENFEAFWLWIRRFQIRTQLFYAAAPDLSVARIKQLAAFKRNFDQFVARVRSPERPPHCLDDLFDEFLRENLQFADGFPASSGVFRDANKETET